MRTLNPYYYHLKDWMMGIEEDGEQMTRAQLASRATCLAVVVLALLQVPDDRSTATSKGCASYDSYLFYLVKKTTYISNLT